MRNAVFITEYKFLATPSGMQTQVLQEVDWPNFICCEQRGEVLEEKSGIRFRSRSTTVWANLDENLHFRAILKIKSGMRICSPRPTIWAYYLSLIQSLLELSSRDRAGIMTSIINVKKLSKSFNNFPRLGQLVCGRAWLSGAWRGPSSVLAIVS